jgi:hypothetical protein
VASRVVLMFALTMVVLGCKKRQQPEVGGEPIGTPSPPAANRPALPSRPTEVSAAKTLRDRGAEVITSDGKPDSPVSRVNLTGPRFGDDSLPLLLSFRFLRYVDLSGSKVTDAGLKTLAECENLNWINLSGTAITDTGVAHLARLRLLSELVLQGTSITDRAIDSLSASTVFKIDLRGTKVTEAGRAQLKQAKPTMRFAEDAPFAEYRAPDGTFVVSFPWLLPKPRVRMERTPFGVVQDTAYEVDTRDWSVLLAVADLGTPGQPVVEPEKLVKAGRDEIARSLKATVAKEDRQDHGGGNVIWEFTYTFPDRPGQGPLHHRAVIHGRRIYTMMILVNGGTVPPADRDRFFNSLKIQK